MMTQFMKTKYKQRMVMSEHSPNAKVPRPSGAAKADLKLQELPTGHGRIYINAFKRRKHLIAAALVEEMMSGKDGRITLTPSREEST